MAEPQQSTQFFSLEDDAAINQAMMASYEKNLARIAVHSLSLLKQVAKDLGVAIEDLDTQKIIEWFEQEAKTRVEKGPEATFLKW